MSEFIKKKDKKILWDTVEKSRTNNSSIRTNLSATITVNNKFFHGFNSRKSHPLQKKFGDNDKAIYLHAEMDAIRKAYRVEGNISGGKLYVARTKADGEIGMACPCEACEEAIEHFGISQTFFTTENGYGLLQ